MRLGIHQPEHAPWLGFFDKFRTCDAFVLLDTVQFKKNDFQNRNKLKSGWITVPVAKHPLDTEIQDIKIAPVDWKNAYLSRFQSYKFTPHFDSLFPYVDKIIHGYHHWSVSELNIQVIALMAQYLGVRTPMVRASSLGLPKVRGGNDVVLQICKHFGTEVYVSGSGGRNYLQLDDFAKANIEVQFNEPDYPHLSAFDHLFTYGPTT